MVLNVINAVAITLLVAVISIVPVLFFGHYVPYVLNPRLQQVALAAWLGGFISWLVSRSLCRREMQRAHQSSTPRAVGLTIAFLAVAACVVIVLRFYGDDLLG